MNVVIKAKIVLLLAALTIVGCTSAPANDPYNDADSQRSRSKQAQDEMSRDTSK